MAAGIGPGAGGGRQESGGGGTAVVAMAMVMVMVIIKQRQRGDGMYLLERVHVDEDDAEVFFVPPAASISRRKMLQYLLESTNHHSHNPHLQTKPISVVITFVIPTSVFPNLVLHSSFYDDLGLLGLSTSIIDAFFFFNRHITVKSVFQ